MHHAEAAGPDFSQGIASGLPGREHACGTRRRVPVLLSRFGGEWFAVDGTCTHYGAALADGLIEGSRSTARSTTPASTSRAAPCSARRRSTRSAAGKSS